MSCKELRRVEVLSRAQSEALFLKNFENNARLLDGGPLKNLIDFTSASPEVTGELLATPKSDSTSQNNP
jgi:hypothetical protein